MSPKKIVIITIPFIAILITLFFIPTNEFLNTNEKESPSPIMIFENSDDVLVGIKIIPVSCNETTSGLTESNFQITNTNENNYEVGVEVSFTDNEAILYEKQVKVKILSGQTVNQNHLSDDVYENP
ncbi:MAG: hypothetical protein ACE5RB_09115, partial [Nitrosopumilus sp.]